MNSLRNDIIDLFEEALADHGQNKRVGTIYAHLIASQTPLTQDQLAEDLNISNSTVSRALTSLKDSFKLIKSRNLSGTKKAEYMISENSFDKLLTVGIEELYDQYRNISLSVKSIKKTYKPQMKEKSKDNEFYKNLLNTLETSIKFHTEKLGELSNFLRERNY